MSWLERTPAAPAALLCALLALPAGPAAADEIRVLSAAAMQSVLKGITANFARETGHTVRISYATMGAITQRMLDGESADLVIGSTPSIETLTRAGKIAPETQAVICKVGIGVVVPRGAPRPPIASIEDFKAALFAATVIVYADPARGGAAGTHVAKVLAQLGIAEPLRARTRFGEGGDVTEVTLAQGEGALGITQISEIVGKPAATFVGPLPDELQNYTGVAAGIPTGGRNARAARAFIDFLQGPTAAFAIKAKGMQPE